MKSIEELEEMLVAELYDSLDVLRRAGPDSSYTKLMGSTGELLSYILQAVLERQVAEWSKTGKWTDGSLLHDVELDNNHLAIEGIMFWGRHTSEQWTDPFYFEIELDPLQKWYTEYVFLFGDQDKIEENFDPRPYKWKRDQRKWKYYIFSADKSITP